jgi:hypothetical protein
MEVQMYPELSELREFLNCELLKRQGFKPQYSMRAFARDTGISQTSLNDFMSGKRDLSLKNIDRVFRYLKRQTPVSCSWCGTPKPRAKLLIGGPKSQFICKSCVDVCNEIIRTGKVM